MRLWKPDDGLPEAWIIDDLDETQPTPREPLRLPIADANDTETNGSDGTAATDGDDGTRKLARVVVIDI